MLDKIREMAKNGQREEAKRLLEELRKMMENATPMMAGPGQQRQQNSAASRPGNQQAAEMMNQLDRLSRRQNQLLGEVSAKAASSRVARASRATGQRGQQGQQGQQASRVKGQQKKRSRGNQPGDGQWGEEQQRAGKEGLRRQLGSS